MIKYVFLILTLLFCFQLNAQLVEVPLPNKTESIKSVPYARQQTVTLTLPFWDDFSTSRMTPSNLKWASGDQVRISNGTGIQPPTLNVAVFDGVDANGSPYNANSLINGETDSLVSHCINLSNLPPGQADSVFISFYWQVTGNGELPDLEDSLSLQFKNATNNWITVWTTNGGIDLETGSFFQELIPVEDSFFHDKFQFKFQSYSRLAGSFDTWLVDYIYLDDKRYPEDSAYLDRALTRKPSFLTSPYSAMPTEQFFSDPSTYLQETDTEFINLNSSFQPVQFTTIVTDLVSDNQIEVLNDDRVASPLPGAFERRTFNSPALDPNNLNALADSLWLETTYSIRSGDNFYIESIDPGVDTTFNRNIDYRVNDTVRTVTVLNDYFAYDDGEPDFAAGINQRGGQLAYAYYVPQRALLTHIDINFPFVQQAGEPIELYVWRDLDNQPESVLFQDSYSVLRPSTIGEMRAYKLDTPVFVQDTIYIGFQQGTNEFLAVGLDKNNDSGDQMYYNVSGQWRPNEFVKGSFLMRPRFDKEIAANFTPNQGGEAAPINVYPNPSEGILFVKGEPDEITIFDSYGKSIKFDLVKVTNGYRIDLSSSENGIYLLNFSTNGIKSSKRILLSN